MQDQKLTGSVGDASLEVAIVEPAVGAVLPDPGSTPKVKVRFTVKSSGVVNVGAVVSNGVAAAKTAAREGNTNIWSADIDVPPQWPVVQFTARATGKVSLIGAFKGQSITGFESRTATLSDGSPPELKVRSPGVSDGGSGFYLEVEAEAQDHTSGIGHLEWSLNGGPFAIEPLISPPRVPVTWRSTLYTPVIGPNGVRVRVMDRAGHAREQGVTTVTRDTSPPELDIVRPAANEAFLAGEGGTVIPVAGTASDRQSGMRGGHAGVEWALNGKPPFRPAVTSDDWEHWQADVPVADLGFHTIHVRCRDRDGNQREHLLDVQVVSSTKPKSTADLLSPRAYLDALLEFCRDHLRVPGEGPLSTSKLEAALRQPFGKLKEPLSEAGNRPVNALRVVVEVLRRHLAGGFAIPDERRYLLTAYETLLAGLGTSYEEVRLVRSAAPAARIALAERLGLWAKVSRPGVVTEYGILNHFYTASAEERDTAAADGYVVEGIACQVFSAAPPGMVPLYRLRGLRITDHFYTTVESERDAAVARGDYVLEGVACQVAPISTPAPAGMTPLFRLRHQRTGEHFYTIYQAERQKALVEHGYVDEKIACHVYPADQQPQPGLTPLYRLLLVADPRHRVDVVDDELNRLFQDPDHLSEQWLQQTFGLADTTREPLGATEPRPTLLRAQERALAGRWEEQDKLETGSELLPTPVIDPDLITEGDLRVETPGTAVFDLLQARRRVVQAKYEALQSRRAAQPTALSGLTEIVKDVLGPEVQLAELERRMESGVAIGPTLDSLRLTLPGFTFLTRMRALAATGMITDAEWEDVCHLLVQIWKALRDVEWRSEEAERQVLLAPQSFRGGAPPDPLLRWRAPAGARRAWQERLTVRTGELQRLEEGLQTRLANAEQVALPILRDALVAAAVGVAAGSVPFYRLRNEGGHFYTTNEAERDKAMAAGFVDEQVACRVFPAETPHPAGTIPLFRLRTARGHFYTVNEQERADAIAAGMVDEHVACRVFPIAPAGPRGTVPLFRLRGEKGHFYTIDERERDRAIADGLVDEKVACRVCSIQVADADYLTDLLLLDVNLSGATTTTRVRQAIETIQGLVFAKRTGRLGGEHPARDWEIVDQGGTTGEQEGNFDREWQWMGSYDGWRAAMLVFLYPENVLFPHLREEKNQTPAFRQLVKELRAAHRITPEDARVLATRYRTQMAALPEVELTDQLSEEQLRARGRKLATLWATDAGALSELAYAVPILIASHLQRSAEYTAALDWHQLVYAYNLPLAERKIYPGLAIERNTAPRLVRGKHWLREELNPHTIAGTRPNPHTRFTLMTIAGCLLEFGDSEFSRDSSSPVTRARSLYLIARELLGLPDLALKTPSDPSQVLLPNPRLDRLRLLAETQLTKIRQGRNLAGLQRQSDVSSGFDTDRLPGFGGNGQLLPPRERPALAPTPYRFGVLMERGKQLAGLAQQIEAAYFAALEKVDAETYNLQRAGFDLELAAAGVELQSRREAEARNSRRLASEQRLRAELQAQHYDYLLSSGLSVHERESLENLRLATDTGSATAGHVFGAASSAIGGMGAGVTAATIFGAAASGAAASGPLAPIGALVGGLVGLLGGIFSGTAQGAQASAEELNQWAQYRSTQASYERRAQEWSFQSSLAARDVGIATQQERVAEDHVQIVAQETTIAQMGEAHASATAEFLATKFTNVELYEWMGGVLAGIYRYFLQQATATAKLAEAQLVFERQQQPESIIQSDYWTVPEATASTAQPTDRRGLTGSARLLQDIYRLDQYAFESDKRKLNLAQTFSIAELLPIELQQFRQTGVLRFATPMRLYDRRFPGHYLRLIKRVRMSLVALVPATRGISATLVASGLSRVVVEIEGLFREAVIRREPELVALTSAMSASGVFELDPQAEMLLPFESMGVDTTWELQLPKAANPFDYRTIADVLLTIEYTALNSREYRQQVVQQLDHKVSAERAFSIRNRFPDQWYQLNNAAEQAPITVSLPVRRADFPPNEDEFSLESVLLYFAPKDGSPVDAKVADLTFPAPAGAPGAEPVRSAGPAESKEGVISTRRGSWRSITGGSPVGTWSLTIGDGPTLERFREGEVEDLLLVIGYRAEMPVWT